MKQVGVLALQGDFERHFQKLQELGLNTRYVREPKGLENLSGLVIPGGESTTFLKLLKEDFFIILTESISKGLPVFATCAGLILLAKEVKDPEQRSLGVLDISVRRNAYGRQVHSFIESDLRWTHGSDKKIEGVFIRAPKIDQVGSGVQVLIERDGEPVLVCQGNIWGATFHPELSEGTEVYQRWITAMTF